MLFFLLKIFIFILPFLLLLRYEDKRKGLLHILGGVAGAHLFIALGAQSLEIFTLQNILIAHGTIGLACTFFTFKSKIFYWSFKDLKIHPASLLVLIFILYKLFTLHFDYTGTVVSIEGVREVTHASYEYPLYSDEWIAAGLAGYSIQTGKLPLVNILDHYKPFINFLAGFHSLLAELMLFWGLTPLTSYVYFSILGGILIPILVYFLLQAFKVPALTAALASSLIPFITNSGNLPGIFYLLPWNLGFIFFLLALIALKRKEEVSGGFFMLLSILVYPPIFIFTLPSLFVYLYQKNENKKLLYIAAGLFASIILGSLIFKEWGTLAFAYLVRENLDGAIPSYLPWHIIPFFILPFSFYGFWLLIKEKNFWLLTPISISVLYWIVYTFLLKVVVIEHGRIIVICSIFMIFLAGLSLRSFKWPKGSFSKYFLFIGVFLALTGLAYLTPGKDAWKKLAISIETPQDKNQRKKSFSPEPPVNYYLQKEELALFQGIKEKNFLSPPWKGLVLGVATPNFPLHSKASTLGTHTLDYFEFMRAECREKSALAKKYNAHLIYSSEFKCSNFSEIGRSAESLVLYRFSR